MRHQKSGIKLNRTSSHRQAMFRNMVTSLFKYDRIRTTDAKAKELRRWADRMITLAKKGDLHSRRQVLAIMREKDVVHKLFEKAQERFGSINGGYTRIIKLGRRPGDAASISLIELISADEAGKKKKKAKSAARKPAKAAAEKAPAKKTKPKTAKAVAEAPEEKAQEAAAESDSAAGPAEGDTAVTEAAPETKAPDGIETTPETEVEAAAEPAEEPAPAEEKAPATKKPAKKKAPKKEE